MKGFTIGFFTGFAVCLSAFLIDMASKEQLNPICSDDIAEVRQYQQDCLQNGNTVIIKAYCGETK